MSAIPLWPGEPAVKECMLSYVRRIIAGLNQCCRIHYSYMVSPNAESEHRAINFRSRLTWVFEGKLYTTAAFEGQRERRAIEAGELFFSGPGGWDMPEIARSDCRALAILFYPRHIRLVYSDFRGGKVVDNPYFHSARPAEGIGALLLEALNRLLAEPREERDARALPLCRALLEQLTVDLQRETLGETAPADHLVTRMAGLMQQNFHLPISCGSVCDLLDINRSHGSTLFHSKTGKTLKGYLLSLRMEKALWLLECYDSSIEEIAHQCGFFGANYFIRVFRETHGISPGEFRQRRRAAEKSE